MGIITARIDRYMGTFQGAIARLEKVQVRSVRRWRSIDAADSTNKIRLKFAQHDLRNINLNTRDVECSLQELQSDRKNYLDPTEEGIGCRPAKMGAKV